MEKSDSKKTSKKTTKKSKFVFSKTRILIFMLICALLGGSMFFSKPIEDKIMSYSTHGAQLSSYQTALNNDFIVHFVDVGQGDCIMLELPDGKKGIIDAGDDNKETEEHLVEYAKQNVFDGTSDNVFDFLILTHSDSDHVGGMDAVFENFVINTIYRPKIFYNKTQNATTAQSELTNDETERANELGINKPTTKSTNIYFEFLTLAYSEKDENGLNAQIIFSEAGLEISDETAGYNIKFYSPNKDSYSDVNDFSPIIIASYKDYSIALTGDAEKEVEEEVLELYKLPNVDALKLGHHGSSSSTTQAFLEALDPEYIFITVGAGNKYGHPTEEVLKRLEDYNIGTNIFRTDQNGDIIFSVGKQIANSDSTNEQTVQADSESYGILIAISEGDGVLSYIKWWQIVSVILVISFFLCFLTKKEIEKKAKNEIKKAISK